MKSVAQPTSMHHISLMQDAFKTFKEQINQLCYAEVNSPKKGSRPTFLTNIRDSSAMTF